MAASSPSILRWWRTFRREPMISALVVIETVQAGVMAMAVAARLKIARLKQRVF